MMTGLIKMCGAVIDLWRFILRQKVGQICNKTLMMGAVFSTFASAYSQIWLTIHINDFIAFLPDPKPTCGLHSSLGLSLFPVVGQVYDCVAGELCKLAWVTGPEFPHPFSPVGRCLPATGRCHTVRYKRQCLPGFCTMCWKVLVNPPPPPPPPPEFTCWESVLLFP